MKYCVLIFLLTITSFQIKGQSDSINFDRIKIINYENAYEYAFKYEEPFRNSTLPDSLIPYKLTDNDYKTIEILVMQAVEKYNKTEAIENYEFNLKIFPDRDLKLTDFQINLKEYYRQYLACTINAESFVYINFVCNSSWTNDWTNEDKNILVGVDGGGICYFHLVVNLNKKIFYSLEVNSDI